MKGVSSAPGDYVYFKSQVPLHKIPIGTKQWRYYDFGPKTVPPLICIPGIAGTADVYYKQIMSLSVKLTFLGFGIIMSADVYYKQTMSLSVKLTFLGFGIIMSADVYFKQTMSLSVKGYRVISVDIPRVWNYHEWIQAFEKFLDTVDVHHVHLYGTSLGGFLAQLFAHYRPRRVKSLVLSNTYLDTRTFAAAMPWAPFVSWTPSFLLKRYVLTGIRDGLHEPFIADSVDFSVSQVETLSKDDLASRLTLTVDEASVGSLLLSGSSITIMDTNDYCAIPQHLKDELTERYPEARRASLKTGGDFPFLSRPDEVNLHLQLHLRRVGVEPRPEVVKTIPKDDTDGTDSSSQSKRKTDEKDDRSNNMPEGSASSSSYQSPTFPESLGSSNDPPLPTDTIHLQSPSIENLKLVQLTGEVYQSCVLFSLCYCTLVMAQGGFISKQSV